MLLAVAQSPYGAGHDFIVERGYDVSAEDTPNRRADNCDLAHTDRASKRALDTLRKCNEHLDKCRVGDGRRAHVLDAEQGTVINLPEPPASP